MCDPQGPRGHSLRNMISADDIDFQRQNPPSSTDRRSRALQPGAGQRRPQLRTAASRWLLVLVTGLLSGCSAIYHPYDRTIEHRMEVLSRMPRSEQVALDPRLLSQTPPMNIWSMMATFWVSTSTAPRGRTEHCPSGLRMISLWRPPSATPRRSAAAATSMSRRLASCTYEG